MSIRSVMRRVGSLVLATLALATLAQAGVIVVDPGGGDGAALLQATLAAAGEGDIVLVRAGSYELGPGQRFLIDGKGLTLVTDTSPAPVLCGLEIIEISMGSTATVRGFTIGPVSASNGIAIASLEARSASGGVWVEDCTLVGQAGSTLLMPGLTSQGAPAVSIYNCDAVTLQRCSLTGGRGQDYGGKPLGTDLMATSGGPGLTVRESTVSVHDCTLLGGNGGDGKSWTGGLPGGGGPGAFMHFDSTVLFAGCTATGGSNGTNTHADDAAGDGLTVSDSSCAALLRDSTFVAGAVVPEGVPGAAIAAPAGTTETYTAAARHFVVTGPVQEGAAGTLSVDGEPGDVATLLLALQTYWTSFQSRQGVLVLSPLNGFHIVPLGATDVNGDLTVGFTAPNLPASLMGITIPMQLLVSNGGVLTLEAASAFVWLDSSL
jgi:hypothetical protein